MLLVGHEILFEGLRIRVLERADARAGMIGLYAEREIRKWRGTPNRLFKEKLHKGRMRAFGSGPHPVQPAQTYNPQVGSEGLIAWLVTEICRLYPDRFTSHPGPVEIREKKVGTFLLLTDFIGSGDRARTYLSSAWRVASVRSWNSGDLMDFAVVAYSGLATGIDAVRKHPASPIVSFVAPCPSIDSTFPPAEAVRLKAFCVSHDPISRDPVLSLGHGGGGALIAFAHGCPNNAPRLLHAVWKGRPALFPKRVTSGIGSHISTKPSFADVVERLQALGRDDLAGASALSVLTEEAREMVLFLSAAMRGPRFEEAIASRTGLTLLAVERLAKAALGNGWTDARRRVTDAGRAHLAQLARKRRIYGVLHSDLGSSYFPKSLRAP